MKAVGATALIAVVTSVLYISQGRIRDQGALESRRPRAAALVVDPRPSVTETQPIGINLGTWTSWGAEQYASNVLKNPGFEGVVDRSIVIVRRADAFAFSDDNEFLGRPDGFWAGARYDIRTGKSAGRSGSLAGSDQKGPDGFPRYFSDSPLPPLAPGDAVALTRVNDDSLPANWWFPQESISRVGIVPDVPDGSPGRRSLALRPEPSHTVAVISYLDALEARAGKLLPVNGTWRLSFQGRLVGGAAHLRVELRREGSAALLSRTVDLGRSWARTSLEFAAADDGPAGILQLQFLAQGEGEIHLDDVELTPADSGSAFRDEVQDVLASLHPGYLRDWQGQLGDTLANRLAPPFERRVSRYRPGQEETQFFYSLPEFLDLCSRIRAIPWIVVPTTFSDEENLQLGRFLSANAASDRFGEVLVEFGNENWNPLFRAAGIPDPAAHAEAFQRALSRIRRGAGGAVRLLSVANGQNANPEYAAEVARQAKPDILAVAPYFMYHLEAGTTGVDRLAQLFTKDTALPGVATLIQELHQELGVYEVNLHCTEGTAPQSERDPVVAGMASGAALAKRLIDSLLLGARRQCVYVLAGYDTKLSQLDGYTKLWGVVRDFGPTMRRRPTGLALAMLNRVVSGNLHPILVPERAAELTGAAFQSEGAWQAALVSSSSRTISVSIEFPSSPPAALPQRLLTLEAPGPEATNEESEQVRMVEETISPRAGKVVLTLPPYTLVVLTSAGRKQ